MIGFIRHLWSAVIVLFFVSVAMGNPSVFWPAFGLWFAIGFFRFGADLGRDIGDKVAVWRIRRWA